jgi:hypothetical protein
VAETVGKLAYQLTVDNGQFTTGMQQAGQQIDKLSQQSQAGGSAIERAFGGVTGSVGKAFESFKGGGGVAGAIGSVVGDVKGLATEFIGLAGLGGTFATGFIAGFALLQNEADKTAKKISEIGKLAKVLGESTGNTQILQNVFGSVGFDEAGQTQILLRFFDKLGDLRKNLANGGGETGSVLRQIGLDPAAIAASSPEAAIEQIVVALGKVPNAYDRANASQALFGRAFVDVEPLIRRGGRAFQEARADLAAFGTDAATVAAATEANMINRELSRNFRREVSGPLGRAWEEVMVGISLATARGRRSVDQFGYDYVSTFAGRTIRRPGSPDGAALPQPVAFDAVAAAAAERTRKAGEAAAKLATNWERSAATIGMTTRQAEIYNAVADRAPAAEISRLRAADELFTRKERLLELEKEINGVLTASNSATFTFGAAIGRLNEAALNGALRSGAAQDQALASTFLGGRESFVNNGVAAGSVDAARIVADIETRRNNGQDDAQTRVLSVLEASREIAAQQLEESRQFAEALRNVPGLGVATVRGN